MESVGDFWKRKPKVRREGGMANASDFMAHHFKYQRLQKPLTAARVCDTARELASGHFTIVSFRGGLLTAGVKNSYEAAELQMQSQKFIESINGKLEQELVEKMRFKIVQ